MKISGIYKIENKINGKVYIGSAVDIHSRWHRHKHDLKNNKHCSIKLQRSYIKYGPEAFEFSVIEEISDISSLLSREQEYLDNLKCVDTGFNIARYAGNTLGVYPSDDQLRKRSLFSESDIQEIFRLRSLKLSIIDIAKIFKCGKSTIHNYICGRTKVANLVCPSLEKQSAHLSLNIKAEILDMYSKKVPRKTIAEKIGVHPSTITCFLKREGFNNPFKKSKC